MSGNRISPLSERTPAPATLWRASDHTLMEAECGGPAAALCSAIPASNRLALLLGQPLFLTPLVIQDKGAVTGQTFGAVLAAVAPPSSNNRSAHDFSAATIAVNHLILPDHCHLLTFAGAHRSHASKTAAAPAASLPDYLKPIGQEPLQPCCDRWPHLLKAGLILLAPEARCGLCQEGPDALLVVGGMAGDLLHLGLLL